jgi:LmbE family N-acetylglucosaminyl deacetylase/CTP:molybdopterin cytidylyltransferase MocA
MNDALLKPLEAQLIPYSAVQGIAARSVLVLAPHPDDEIFGCGGAILKHVKAGAKVVVVVVTDGSLGGPSHERLAESRAAAKVLGYGEPFFWGQEDRALLYSEALVQRLLCHMDSDRTDLLYAPSPWEMHPDHRQAMAIATEAARRYTKPLRLAYYEVGAPLQPNVLLDISAEVDTKLSAMKCFVSQLGHQDYLGHIHGLNVYRTYTLPPTVKAAEAYRLLEPGELAAGWSYGFQAFPQRWDGCPRAGDVPMVSVVVRSMDIGYLSQALDSIALQNYPQLEVVVVAARPDHQPLPPKCGPFPMRLVLTSEPLPRSRAANAGLQNARGEFVIFLDDDDWLMPGHIARLATTLQAHPFAPAAYTGISLVDAKGAPIGQAFDLPYDAVQQLAGNLTPIHAVLFRAGVVAQGCRFDESLDRYEDWDFWLQLSRLGPMVHLPGVSAVYRIHDSSGVHQDAGPLGVSAQVVYEKWRSHWNNAELGAMMQRVWAFPEQETALQKTRSDLADLQMELHRHQLLVQKQNQEISGQASALAEQAAHIVRRDQTIASQSHEIHTLNVSAAKQSMDLALVRDELRVTVNSRSWRLTRPLRWLTGAYQRWRPM